MDAISLRQGFVDGRLPKVRFHILLLYRSIRYRQRENSLLEFFEIDVNRAIKQLERKRKLHPLIERVLRWQPFYDLNQFI
jgi:hypothetical protein